MLVALAAGSGDVVMALPVHGDEARDFAARSDQHAETRDAYYRRVAREQQHARRPIAHHKGQTQDVSGGRSALKHRTETDAGRGRGRAITAKPLGAGPEGIAGEVPPESASIHVDQSEDADNEFLRSGVDTISGTPDTRPTAAQRKNLALMRARAERQDAEAGIVKHKPLPKDHPSVLAEIKHDRIERMMQEVPNQHKGNLLDEADIGDPFAADLDSDDDYID